MADLPSWLETRPTDARDSLMSGLQIGLEFKQNRQRNELAKAELGQQAQEIQQRGQRLQIEDQVLQQGMKLKIQDAQRKNLVESVAVVSAVSSLPGPDILKDFDAIRASNPNPTADEQLLAALQ